MVKNKERQVVYDKTVIYEMRQAGATLREIGEKVGVSRERVRQILLHTFGSTSHNLLSTAQVCILTGLRVNRIIRLYKQGVIKPAFKYNIGGQRHLMWPDETVQLAKEYYDLHRFCRVCSRPLPQNRTCYCSDFCKQERYKYKNLSLQEKQRVRARRHCYMEKKREKALQVMA